MKTIYVHGFLGTGEVSLFSPGVFDASHSFDQWADNFLATIDEPIQAIGYSLGGRLLAHAFLKQPDLFDQLILVSSNPFKLSESQKLQRQEFDAYWTDRFLSAAWAKLLVEWDALPVFSGSKPPPLRPESAFDRKLLSLAFQNWSPTKQTLSFSDFGPYQSKIHYMHGLKDKKYSALAEVFKNECSNITIHALPDEGHRIDLATSMKSL